MTSYLTGVGRIDYSRARCGNGPQCAETAKRVEEMTSEAGVIFLYGVAFGGAVTLALFYLARLFY